MKHVIFFIHHEVISWDPEDTRAVIAKSKDAARGPRMQPEVQRCSPRSKGAARGPRMQPEVQGYLQAQYPRQHNYDLCLPTWFRSFSPLYVYVPGVCVCVVLTVLDVRPLISLQGSASSCRVEDSADHQGGEVLRSRGERAGEVHQTSW